MVLDGYLYHYSGVGKQDEPPLIKEHKYTFKNGIHLQYIVNVEEYKHDVYVLKFHLKNHSDSKKKYSLLLCKSKIIKNEKESYHYIEARKVLHTCINIGYEIYSKNKYASFGFIGMPTVDGLNIEELKETKRFKVYQKLAKFFFQPENFEHRRNKEKSIYLLLNKKKVQQRSEVFDEIKTMFTKTFDIDEMYANLTEYES